MEVDAAEPEAAEKPSKAAAGRSRKRAPAQSKSEALAETSQEGGQEQEEQPKGKRGGRGAKRQRKGDANAASATAGAEEEGGNNSAQGSAGKRGGSQEEEQEEYEDRHAKRRLAHGHHVTRLLQVRRQLGGEVHIEWASSLGPHSSRWPAIAESHWQRHHRWPLMLLASATVLCGGVCCVLCRLMNRTRRCVRMRRAGCRNGGARALSGVLPSSAHHGARLLAPPTARRAWRTRWQCWRTMRRGRFTC